MTLAARKASGLQAGCRCAGASLRESCAGYAPRGAGREQPGKAGSAAPLNFGRAARAAAPGRERATPSARLSRRRSGRCPARALRASAVPAALRGTTRRLEHVELRRHSALSTCCGRGALAAGAQQVQQRRQEFPLDARSGSGRQVVVHHGFPTAIWRTSRRWAVIVVTLSSCNELKRRM